MKRGCGYRVLFFGIFFMSQGIAGAGPEISHPGITQDFAIDASDQQYFQKLREIIIGAQKSIDISAEEFFLSDAVRDPIADLIEDLIRAQKKGVRVRLFLNTFSGPERPLFFLREDILYKMRREGVEVHFVNPSYRLSDRLVIVDSEKVLEGGIAWNKQDLEKGMGSAVLVHSSALAEKKRIRLEFLPLWDVEKNNVERIEGGVAVPFYLMREVKLFPRMVDLDDGDGFKIYLALLRIFYQTKDVHLTAAFDELGQEIPADVYHDKAAVRFQVAKALERLAVEYQLIEVEKKEADQFRVRLILPSQTDPAISIPLAFFHENYAKELSPAAIFSYFVICYRTQVSGEAPVWLGSEHNVEQDFPVTKEQFRRGVAELRNKNLVEVFPFKLKEGYRELEALEYRYLVNPVATLSQRLEVWDRLRKQFGDDSFKQARDFAGVLGEPEDPKIIAVYLELLKNYRSEDILSFTERIAALPPRSTPDLIHYLRTLLEHETQKNIYLATN